MNDPDWAVPPDGLAIRLPTAADRAAPAKLPDRVSPQSAIGRFPGALNNLTDLLPDRLLDLKPKRHGALVAAGGLGIPGAARFIRDEDASSTAEVAIIIADDWQHQRVARLMLERPKFT